MARAKGYNPFGMWGSYVGALLGLIPLLIFLMSDGFKGLAILPIILITIVGTPLGFLIGYGIHYMFRKSANRKKMAGLRSRMKKRRK